MSLVHMACLRRAIHMASGISVVILAYVYSTRVLNVTMLNIP